MPRKKDKVLVIRSLGKRSSIESGVVIKQIKNFFSVHLDIRSKRNKPIILTLEYKHLLHNFNQKSIKL